MNTTGLLTFIATDFSISITKAGYMATTYALGVFIAAPILIILGAKIPKKNMLILLMLFFITGNTITAWSPTFSIALLGRFITTLTHGAFIGIRSIIAAALCKGK